MAGIGDLFGLGGGTQAPTPGLLDAAGYMDPAQYDRMRQSQSMMGLWAGLLAGGGPSLTPRNFGSALGAGLTGAQQFGSQFDESQRYRAEAQKNLADITAKKQGFELAKEYLKGGVLPAGTPGAAPAPGSGSSTPNFGAGSGGGGSDPRGVEPYIRAEAARLNIDPDIAVRVARSEGLGTFLGDGGKSGGAFQLYTGGGVGNMFERDTGLSPLDPANEKATITYALQHAAKNGWGAWNGARKIGITGFTGIGERGAAPATTTELSAVPDFAGMFSGNQGASYAPVGPTAAPVPTVLTPPGTNPNAPPAPGAGAALGTGRTVLPPGRGLITPQDYADWQASGRVPSGPVNVGPSAGPSGGAAAPSSEIGGGLRYAPGGYGWRPPVPVMGNGPVNVRPLSGEAAPAEAGPSFGYGSAGGAISPATAAAAAGAPPVPAAALPRAQPVPAPAPAGAIPPPAAAAAPAPAGTRPPAGPGEVTVTLPKPPALGEMLPVPAAQPQPLPAAPEVPGIPARPQIPGATPGAAVSPAVAARARQAQGVVLGLSMMGVHVPDFLQKEAGIEIAGRTAAAEAEAKQPIELQNKAFEASLTAAQKRWDALTDQQKETLAFQRNMTKDQMNAMYANIHEQYKSILGLTTARAMEEQKTAGGAENTQITMVIGNREVPMTVAQANRISRGEAPEQVLGPGVLQLGKAANTGQIPEGYQMVPGADGGGPRMEPLPGSPQARALDQKQTSQQQNASVVTQDLRRAQDLVSGGYVTGLYGRGAQLFPGTDRTRFDALVGGIGANFSIDRLQQMRDASPTGGALGQVTEGEHKLLRDSFGSLNPEQGEKQLSENIGRVHQRYMDIVNGTPEQLGKMLREGRITKDRYDTLIAQRDLPAGGGAATPTTPGGAIRTPYGTIRPVQ